MTQEDFAKLIRKNKEEVKQATEEFEQHSKNFNEKIKKLISLL